MKRSVLALLLLWAIQSPALADASRAISPDGRLTAAIVPIGKGTEDGSDAEALVVGKRGTRQEIRLITSRYDDDFRRNLTGLSNPIFSLDGGFLYFSSTDASPNTGAIHQINLRTRVVRFVVAGTALKVIRTGPYRGFLLVQQHRYYDHKNGSHDPVYVIRPDGHLEFMVPGSETDDSELAIDPWLAKKGWRAW